MRLDRVDRLITGRDGVIRGAKVCVGKSVIQRPVQFLYLLELSCDVKPPKKEISSTVLNPETPVFRHKRNIAIVAEQQIHELAKEEV